MAIGAHPAVAFDPFVEESRPVKRELSVVEVRTYDAGGKGLAQGCGFIISHSGDIITSSSLFRGAARAEVATADRVSRPVESVVAEDGDYDILWVRASVPRKDVKPLALDTLVPVAGDPVMALVGVLQMTNGTITGVREFPGIGRVYLASTPISSVSSGCPVVNTSGRVVGMATFLAVGGHETVLVVPADRIRSLKPGPALSIAKWKPARSDPAQDLLFKGQVLMWESRWEKALSYLAKAAEIAPGNSRVQVRVAQCCTNLGRMEDAASALRQVVVANPSDPAAYYNLAVVYGELGWHDRIIKVLSQALAIKAEFPEALTLSGWARLQKGSLEDAVAVCKQAISIKPDYDEAHVVLGSAYAGMGNHEWAMNAFGQALRINPRNAAVYEHIGSLHGKRGEYQKEVEAFSKSVALNSASSSALRNLGKAYTYHLKDFPKAIEAFERALVLRPNDVDTRYELGMAHLAAGDRPSAQAQYKSLQEMNSARASQLLQALSR